MTISKVVLTLAASAAMALAAGDAKAGAEVYTKACKSCHGADGAANPAIAKMMKVEMRHLGEPALQSLPEGKWKSVVSEGTGKMKPIKSIEGKQVDDVVAFCKTLKK